MHDISHSQTQNDDKITNGFVGVWRILREGANQ